MSAEQLKTPLYDEHVALGARLVPFAGFLMPIQYRGISHEHTAVRTKAGIFDVSHMGELVVRAENAVELVNRLVTNDVAKLSERQALYTCCCNESGTILDDLIVYKRRQDELLVVCNASNHAKILAHFLNHIPPASLRDESAATALIALQGPQALAVLERAGARFADGELPKPFRISEASLAGASCTVAHTGYTGEDGVEIFSGNEAAPVIWRALLAAGAEPAGLGARDTLRLEARLSLYGNDIDETTNPLEAGLGWTVKLDKPGFIGKQALLAVKEQGVRRKLVGFEVTGRGIARQGYPLHASDGAASDATTSSEPPKRKPIGVCTSGSPSPTLGKNIGLGYVPSELASVGTPLLVDCRGKLVAARIVETPFYKRPKSS